MRSIKHLISKKNTLTNLCIGLAAILCVYGLVLGGSCWILTKNFPWFILMIAFFDIIILLSMDLLIRVLRLSSKEMLPSKEIIKTIIGWSCYAIVCGLPLIAVIRVMNGNYVYSFHDVLWYIQLKILDIGWFTPYEKGLLYIITSCLGIWSLPMAFSKGTEWMRLRKGANWYFALYIIALFCLLIATFPIASILFNIGPVMVSDWIKLITATSLVFWLWAIYDVFKITKFSST